MNADAIRFYRRDDLDSWAHVEAGVQDEDLRRLVDQLPTLQRHAVERIFFGGATKARAAQEAGVDPRALGDALEAAFTNLREALLSNDEVGPVSAAFLEGRAVQEPSPVGCTGQAA